MDVKTDDHGENIFCAPLECIYSHHVKNKMEWVYGVLADITATAASIFGAPDPRPVPKPAGAQPIQSLPQRRPVSMEDREARIRNEIHVRNGRIEAVQAEMAVQQTEYTAILRRLCTAGVQPTEKTSLTAKANILKKRVELKRKLLEQLSQQIVVLETTLVTMETGLANRTMQESVVGASSALGTERESDAMRESFDKAAETINERATEDGISMGEAVRAMFPDDDLGEDSLENDLAEMRAMLEDASISDAEPATPTPTAINFPAVPQTVPNQEPVSAVRAAANTRALLRRAQ